MSMTSGYRARGTDQTRPGQTRPDPTSGRFAWIQAVLDRPLTSFHLVIASAGLLLGLGVLMVLSASSVYAYQNAPNHDPYYFVKRQIVFMVVGLIAILIVARLRLSSIKVLGWIALFGSMILLIMTYTSLGVTVNGNRNWLQFGSPLLRIQPSEFAKLAMIIWAADVLSRKQKLLDQPKHLLIPFVPVTGLMILLVVFQGDAGTAVVMAAIVACVLWIVGAPMRIFVALGVVGVAGVVGLFATSANRMARLFAFLNPGTETSGANLQTTVAMHAIASGGWWGVGLGASRQKWGSLPEAHTDFIFAVIGEELGLFGSLMVLLLFLVLGYAGIRIALRSSDNFCRYAAAGITAWFVVQALINLGVVLRLLPVAGVPLPLMSYGGSALLANLIAIGVLINCARREPAALALISPHRQKVPPAMTTVVGSRPKTRTKTRASESTSSARRR